MKYFLGSYLVTIFGLIAAFFWGEHRHPGSGWMCVFVAFVLAVLEVNLSFDNAVVNAMKLEKMSKKWQHRFLTWGIAIAVFGMRFLFPVLIVAIFAKLNLMEVVNIALNDADKYAHYLHLTHVPLVAFGGTFLLMLFFSYFANCNKTLHWIKFIERPFCQCANIKGCSTILTLIPLLIVQGYVSDEVRASVLLSGIWGVLIYLLIDGMTHWLETLEAQRAKQLTECAKGAGLMSFIYLELIDASFSLDGVLGAFALSKDVLIITIGLSIGAMFVRSLTVMLVEKKTLAKYLYLEHGAHWAIGALAFIMLISTFHEVPEVVTGLIGLVFIMMAFVTSLIHNKKHNEV